MRKLTFKVPKPRAKAKSMNYLAHVAHLQPAKNGGPYKKAALQGDPTKFGNSGFDLNMLAPSMVQRASQ